MAGGRKTPKKTAAVGKGQHIEVDATVVNQQDDADGSSTSGDAIEALQQQLAAMAKRQEDERRARDDEMKSIFDAIKILAGASQSTGTPRRDNSYDDRESNGSGWRRQRINVSNLEKLDADVTLRDFATWRSKWEDFCTLERIAMYPIKEQVAALRSALKTPMLQVVDMALEIEGERDADGNRVVTPDDILDAIQQHIRSKRNVALDRVDFEECRQAPGEKFDTFFVRLRQLAASADLCEECYDDRLITRIMSGINSSETRKKLLAINPPPKLLQTVVDICRGEESATSNESSLSKGRVNKVSKAKGKRDGSASRPAKDDTCSKCGYKAHAEGKACPAAGQTCKKCGGKNHFKQVCRSSNSSGATKPDKKTDKVFHVRVQRIESSRRVPTVQLTISPARGPGKTATVEAVPDSGAEASVAGVELLRALGLQQKNLTHAGQDQLEAANGSPMESLGRLVVQVALDGRTAETTIIFCRQPPGAAGLLLSWFACKQLGILPDHYPRPCPAVNIIQLAPPEPKRPSAGPRPSTEEIERTRQQLMAEFSDVFDTEGPLKTMAGPAMKIELLPGAKPFCTPRARPIAFAKREKVKAALDKMVRDGVIAPVTEPTDWCHPMVTPPKSDGTPRICVDMSMLNRSVRRPFYPPRAPKDAVAAVSSKARFFTKVDAAQGYHQIELDEESQLLTTFITPWGRFKYLRGNMGLNSTGDEYNRRGDLAMADLPNMVKVVDDILLFDEHYDDHLKSVRGMLERCRRHTITLRPSKFVLAAAEVPYAGYIVGENGTEAHPARVEAIEKFPVPTNLTEMRSFMGMVEQMSEFSAGISAAATPLRPLLSSKSPFIWTADHDAAFAAVKKEFVATPILKPFDPTLEAQLHTDASRLHGLGFALLQKHPDGWKLVTLGSRYLTDTETRWSSVELEMKAVHWSVDKCHLYLSGLPIFTVVVDHQALVPILNKFTLDAVENPRLQRMKEKLYAYNFTTVWKKGKDHALPDALSRAPVSDPTPEDVKDSAEMQQYVRTVIRLCAVDVVDSDEAAEAPSHLPDPILEELRRVAAADAEYQQLIRYVEEGFPQNAAEVELACRQYWKLRHQLATDDGFVLLGCRIVIPVAARKDVRRKLHAAHQGLERTKRRARQTVYWPGITNDLRIDWENCSPCQEQLSSQQREPMAFDLRPAASLKTSARTCSASATATTSCTPTACPAGRRWTPGTGRPRPRESSKPSPRTSWTSERLSASDRTEAPNLRPASSSNS